MPGSTVFLVVIHYNMCCVPCTVLLILHYVNLSTNSLCKVIAFYSANTGNTDKSRVNKKKPWSRAAEHLGHD